jgi:hypothetical protein
LEHLDHGFDLRKLFKVDTECNVAPMARKVLVAIEPTKRLREYGATRSIRAYYGKFLFFHGKGIIFLIRRLLFERTVNAVLSAVLLQSLTSEK